MNSFRDYQHKYEFFKLERDDDGILTVMFHTNGEPVVWGLAPLAEAGVLWKDIGEDPGNKVVILTGAGDGFIPTIGVSGDARMSAELWDKISSDVRRSICNHLDISVPMIAAVNGPARFHSEQALLCDIVIASDNAEFQDAPHFVSGMVPGDGVQIIYNYLLGHNRAKYFLYMGESISAEAALRLGLIGEIHALGRLLDRAREIARHILSQPELVRRYTRRVTNEPIRRLYREYLDQGLALEGLGAWQGWSFEAQEK